MKIICCDQNTPEWHAARCGRVTASRVADIMRKGRNGEPSKMRQTYLGELVAERLGGIQDGDGFTSGPMQWGKDNEDQARQVYALMNDVEPVRIGFVIHPRFDMAGASPDSIIGDDGGLEIKSPNTATHIAFLRSGRIDPDYIKQMQWNMACAERDWWDFASFDPRLPAEMQLETQRVHRDEALITEIERAVEAFLEDVAAEVDYLRQRYLSGETLKDQLKASVEAAE